MPLPTAAAELATARLAAGEDVAFTMADGARAAALIRAVVSAAEATV